jgi:hypothetical protein
VYRVPACGQAGCGYPPGASRSERGIPIAREPWMPNLEPRTNGERPLAVADRTREAGVPSVSLDPIVLVAVQIFITYVIKICHIGFGSVVSAGSAAKAIVRPPGKRHSWRVHRDLTSKC